jgi:hypothetical protein
MESAIEALHGLVYQKVEPNGNFATKYLFKIEIDGATIDLMGGVCREDTKWNSQSSHDRF